jgi:hypothetical protein
MNTVTKISMTAASPNPAAHRCEFFIRDAAACLEHLQGEAQRGGILVDR